MLKQQAFLEYAEVYENFYGTTLHSVETSLKQGLDVILEIDWQGAELVKSYYLTVYPFLLSHRPLTCA